jgi:hypothetical protein
MLCHSSHDVDGDFLERVRAAVDFDDRRALYVPEGLVKGPDGLYQHRDEHNAHAVRVTSHDSDVLEQRLRRDFDAEARRFERYCAPSVSRQSTDDFTWLIFFDPESPQWLKEVHGDRIVVVEVGRQQHAVRVTSHDSDVLEQRLRRDFDAEALRARRARQGA